MFLKEVRIESEGAIHVNHNQSAILLASQEFC